MLENLFKQKDTSKVTIITDTADYRCLPLLKAFILSRTQCPGKVIAVLLDTSRAELGNVATQADVQYVSDPLSWNDHALDLPDLLLPHLPADGPVTVLIDSLTSIALMRSVPYTCQLLHRVATASTGVEIVAALHTDCHDNAAITLIKQSASTLLHVQAPTEVGFHGKCSSVHKTAGGKILRKEENYRLSQNFQLLETQEVRRLAPDVMTDKPDPTANLTFNLSLSDKEKFDRSKVPLPYMHQMTSTSSGGHIFYQPDEADDFDEEDPDDDLDI